MFKRTISLFAFLIATATFETRVVADSWALPKEQTYTSANGEFRFIVIPRDLKSQLAYFSDKVEGNENAGQDSGGHLSAKGKLEQKTSDGSWSIVWEVELANDVAPVNAIVSNDGLHVVTFDNWHSIGYGDNILVGYGTGGKISFSRGLESFLPSYYIDALPHSVSSRYWRDGTGYIDNGKLELEIVVPDPTIRGLSSDRETVTFLFDLGKNYYYKSDTQEWVTAQLSALDSAKQLLQAEKERIVKLSGPLVAKSPMTERDWHGYLREAFWRLVSPDETTATTHLRALTHEEYDKSVEWVKEQFSELSERAKFDDEYIDYASIASSDEANLAQLLIDIAKTARSGEFRNGHFLIVLPPNNWALLREKFAHTGLRMTLVDPTKPIPPSEKRLEQLFNPLPRDIKREMEELGLAG